jgi:hemoglobin-like flavoprotein
LKKVIKEVKQSYYNILIEISNHKVRKLWNIGNDSGKIQRAEKISAMNLAAGNIGNAKEMACTFNKLFLLTVIVDTNTDSSLAMGLATGFSEFSSAGGQRV